MRVADGSGQSVAVAVRVEADLLLADTEADVVGSVGVGLDAEQPGVQGLGGCEVLDRQD